MLSVSCSCGRCYQVKEHNAGKKFRCKSCESVVQVPEQAPAATPKHRSTAKATPSKKRNTAQPASLQKKRQPSKSARTERERSTFDDLDNYEDYEDYEAYDEDWEEPEAPPRKKKKKKSKPRRSFAAATGGFTFLKTIGGVLALLIGGGILFFLIAHLAAGNGDRIRGRAFTAPIAMMIVGFRWLFGSREE